MAILIYLLLEREPWLCDYYSIPEAKLYLLLFNFLLASIMTCSTQVGEDAAIEGSITRIGGWVAVESSAAPPGRFDTDAAVAQSTCK